MMTKALMPVPRMLLLHIIGESLLYSDPDATAAALSVTKEWINSIFKTVKH